MPAYTVQVPPPSAPYDGGILRCKGNQIVNEKGEEVILKGAGLGGWMNMENFITGYPGHEADMRKKLKNVMGEEKYEYFFDKFLENFFTEKDAEFFASLGLNTIRIPFNYRHFESDDAPGVWIEKGFQWIDRLVNLCAKHKIFTILDLHAAPGGQNIDWHSDAGIHRAVFWEYKEFQNRSIRLWEELARRYKGNTWVAGFNPLNEPTDEEHVRVIKWYDEVEAAIRKIDPDHILFFDLNTFASDSSRFTHALPNSVYAYHDYSNFGFPLGGGYHRTDSQKEKLQKSWERKVQFMQKTGTPMWNGEFGPVYADPTDGPGWEDTNKERYNLLQDQLRIYKKAGSSWTIWLYKDIGFQGMTYASPDSPYVKRLAPFLAKKKRLAADEWGTNTSQVKHIFQPLEDWLEKEAPSIKTRYPKTWSTSTHLGRLVRNILLSEELCFEYAEYFRDLSFKELDEFAESFKFENLCQREGLNEVLRSHA
ncbi:endoglucanase family 5 glycoside hydrolase [Phaffia rhodozyma]|uniref:Endoglucanase family 5 glycoside hydrolase n=1 Tax=Phaffia rhodozyma TaxID=264483 RepID=A0A0F7SES8_PHARH|nr:endoglucanase family 5 glycoside hydrolase [Phaffia rhodozyma]